LIQNNFKESTSKNLEKYEYQLENFIFRAVQLRNLLLNFFKTGIQKSDQRKYNIIKNYFKEEPFLALLIEFYRNELTHQGRIYSVVGISDCKNNTVPRPILYIPNQRLANVSTLKKWKKDWIYNIEHYLCLIKRLLNKLN